MSQILRRWLSDGIIDYTKLDSTNPTPFTMRSLIVTGDATVQGRFINGGVDFSHHHLQHEADASDEVRVTQMYDTDFTSVKFLVDAAGKAVLRTDGITWTGNQKSAFGVNNGEYAYLNYISGVTGGLSISGYGKGLNSLLLTAYVDNTSLIPVTIRAYQHNGSGGLVGVAPSTTVLVVNNDSSTVLDILGGQNSSSYPVVAQFYDTTAGIAQGVGGGISFGGRYSTSTPKYADYGGIGSYKENGTSGNYAGYTSIFVRPYTSTAFLEAIHISSAGNVGIGTTSPLVPLHVSNSSATGLVVENTAGAGSYNNQIAFKSNGVYRWQIGTDIQAGGTTGNFEFYSATGSAGSRIWIQPGGNVGIGTSSPVDNLTVNGTSAVLLQGTPSRWLEFDYSAGAAKINLNNTSDVIDVTFIGTPTARFAPPASYDPIAQTAMLSLIGGISGLYNYGPSLGFRLSGQVNSRAVISSVQTGTDNNRQGFAFFTHPSSSSSDPLVEAVRIDHAGNVGIGTTLPSQKVHITGQIWQDNVAATNYAFHGFTNGGGDLYIGKERSTTGGLVPGSIPYSAVINNTSSYPIHFATNATIRMTIDAIGNIGIGTTNPISTVHVENNQNATTSIIVRNTTNDTSSQTAVVAEYSKFFQLGMWQYAPSMPMDNGGLTAVGMSLLYSLNTNGLLIDNHSRTPTYFATNNTVRMMIDAAGNVGIGNTTLLSTTRLTINSAGNLSALSIGNDLNNATPGLRGGTVDVVPGANGAANPGNVIQASYWGAASEGRMTLQTYGHAGQLVLHEGGNVGVGTTVPAYLLHVKKDQNIGTYIVSENATSGSAAASIIIAQSDATNYTAMGQYSTLMNMNTGGLTAKGMGLISSANVNGLLINSVNNTPIYLATNNTAQMTIAANGDIGIGTTAPIRPFGCNSMFEHASGSATGYQLMALSSYRPGQGPIFMLRQSQSSTTGVLTTTTSGAYTGTIQFKGVSSAGSPAFAEGARIEVRQYNAAGTSNVPCDMVIATNSSTADNSQQLVLNQSGSVGIGTGYMATPPAATFHIYDPTTTGSDDAILLQTAVSPAGNKFVVQANGRTGIGTDNLSFGQLYVRSEDKFTLPLQIDQPDSSGFSGMQFMVNGSYIAHAGFGGTTSGSYVSGKAYFGTIGNYDAIFTTNDTVRMTVTNGGIVGIGTTVPIASSVLHGYRNATTPSDIRVENPNVGAGGLSGVQAGFVAGNGTNTVQLLQMGLNNPHGLTGLSGLGMSVLYSDAPNGIQVSSASGAPICLVAGGATILTLTGSGKVGIGTTNPLSMLEVMRAGTADIVVSNYSNTATNQSTFKLQRSRGISGSTLATTNTGDYLGELDVLGVGSGVSRVPGFNLRFRQNGAAGASFVPTDAYLETCTSAAYNTNQLVLDSSGNVGVGTSNPLAKLQVSADGDGLILNGVSDGVSNKASGAIELRGYAATNAFNFGMNNTVNAYEDYRWNLFNTTGAVKLCVIGTGQVGIGTTIPLTWLHVRGDSDGLMLEGISDGINNKPSGAIKLRGYAATDAFDFGMMNTINAYGDYRWDLFNTTGSVKLCVRGTGQVGIGTTIPLTWLHIKGAGDGLLLEGQDGAYQNSCTLLLRGRDSTSTLATMGLVTNTTDPTAGAAPRLDVINGAGKPLVSIMNYGDVGIGTTKPIRFLSANQMVEQAGSGNNFMANVLSGYFTSNTGPITYYRHSRTTTVGVKERTVSNATLGSIHFQGVKGGNLGSGDGTWAEGAYFEVRQSGDATAASVPTDMRLETCSSTGTNSQQLVLSRTGRVGIGTGAVYFGALPAGKLHVYSSFDQTATDNILVLQSSAAGGICFKVTCDGHAYSDYATTMTVPADFAEWTKVKGPIESYAVGDVLMQDPENDLVVQKAHGTDTIYGIITDRATYCGGLVSDSTQARSDTMNLTTEELEIKYNAKRVAMVGHVKCKVAGQVNRGDRLCISDIAGVARTAITSEERMFSFAIARQPWDQAGVGLVEIRLK